LDNVGLKYKYNRTFTWGSKYTRGRTGARLADKRLHQFRRVSFRHNTPGANLMKIRSILIAAAAMTAMAGAASAQVASDAEQATADVKVNFVTPLAIENVQSSALDFGSLIRTGTSAATIQVTAAGQRGTTTGVTPVAAVPVSAARFAVTGTPGESFSIEAEVEDLPAGLSVTPILQNTSLTLDQSGEVEFPVGGTLTVANGTTIAGAQTGTLYVTVSYQ
jgi:hypothetical protein